MAGARRARVWRRRRCVCERSGGGGGVVVAVRGLAAALRGGWVPGEPLVATAARARGGGLGPCASCRPPSFPTPPPSLSDSPGLFPRLPAQRGSRGRAGGDLPLPSGDDPPPPLPVPVKAAAPAPGGASPRPGGGGERWQVPGDGAEAPFPCRHLVQPRAVPAGNMWWWRRRGEEKPGVGSCPGRLDGGVSQCCWRPGGHGSGAHPSAAKPQRTRCGGSRQAACLAAGPPRRESRPWESFYGGASGKSPARWDRSAER